MLKEVKPDGFGLIVRTAAENATAEQLQADVTRLLERWQKVVDNADEPEAERVLILSDSQNSPTPKRVKPTADSWRAPCAACCTPISGAIFMGGGRAYCSAEHRTMSTWGVAAHVSEERALAARVSELFPRVHEFHPPLQT